MHATPSSVTKGKHKMHKGVYTNSRSLEWGHRGALSIATGGGIRDVAEVTQSDLKAPDVVPVTTFHGSLDFNLFYLFFFFHFHYLFILALSILLVS